MNIYNDNNYTSSFKEMDGLLSACWTHFYLDILAYDEAADVNKAKLRDCLIHFNEKNTPTNINIV